MLSQVKLFRFAFPIFASCVGTLAVTVPSFADGVSINFGGPGSGGLPTRNGLPPTCLDSFVYEAGGQAELIYGDEGTDGPPPYGLGPGGAGGVLGAVGSAISGAGGAVGGDAGSALSAAGSVISGLGGGGGGVGFDSSHRINAGITGIRDQGLTTGHGSYLPDAWGQDEFTGSGGGSGLGLSLPGSPSVGISIGGGGASVSLGGPSQPYSPGGGEWSMSGANGGRSCGGNGLNLDFGGSGVPAASVNVGINPNVGSGF